MSKIKHKPEAVLQSNFGFTCLTLHRYIGRLEEIQKENPSFNYKDEWKLAHRIDSSIKALEKMRTMIPEIDNEK